MANIKEKTQNMKALHTEQATLYEEKNKRYGDSFHSTYAEYGPQVALIRLEDKLNRAKTLVRTNDDGSNDESLKDTLMDLANYANMFIMELQAATPTEQEPPEKPARKKRDRKRSAEKAGEKNLEEGPLDGLTKKELAEVIKQLGGKVPKKANREKLMEVINEHPKAKVAVAITSIKSTGSGEAEEEDGDGEGEEE